jgi:hypothetical protein
MLLGLHIIQLPFTVIHRITLWEKIKQYNWSVSTPKNKNKKAHKDKDDSKFEMFLQRYIQNTLCSTCTVWIYIFINIFAINSLENIHTNSVVHGMNI